MHRLEIGDIMQLQTSDNVMDSNCFSMLPQFVDHQAMTTIEFCEKFGSLNSEHGKRPVRLFQVSSWQTF